MNINSHSNFQIGDKTIAKQPYSGQDLFDFLCSEYIANGYLYSGSWPHIALGEKGFHSDVIDPLLAAGLIEKRDCGGLVYELVPDIRKKLRTKHSLCSVWYEKVGDALVSSIRDEVRDTFGTAADSNQNLITVSTLKHADDVSLPDKTDVYCPFSVGQVIELEYDEVSNTPSWVGYSTVQQTHCKAVGRFMVTDIISNFLIQPHMNMIELQSFCPKFNAFYPHDRTMLVFEDIVIQRMREPLLSLDTKIQTAQTKTEAFPANTAEKGIEI